MNEHNINAIKNTADNVDKERVLSFQFEEKVRYMDDLVIIYPKLGEILNQVEECYKSAQVLSKPLCMRINGPYGSGKTTVSILHRKKYPDIKTPEGEERRVLYSIIPCPAYIGGLASKLLRDMGDPFYNKHCSNTVATQRLYYLLKACNVKMIFLDEVQHLVDRNSQKLIRDSSDWFKGLIDETRIPIVFMGLPDSNKIFMENDQLANRVRIVENVYPFQYNDIFRGTISLYDSLLPLKEKSGLADPDLSKRIYLATGGYMKNIHDLLTQSAVFALQNDSNRITMPMFAKAYEKLFYNVIKANPFSAGMDNINIQEQIEQLQMINQVS